MKSNFFFIIHFVNLLSTLPFSIISSKIILIFLVSTFITFFSSFLPRNTSIPVYNITQSGVVPITWGEILGKGKKIAHRYPFEGQIWYPDGDIRNSKFVHNLIVFFFHIIPAYFIDFLMLIFRQKRLWVFFSSNFHRSIYFFRLFSFRGYVSRLRNSVILFHARVSFFCYYYILIFFFFSMVRIQNRISVGLELLQYFTTREWVFHNTNLLTLWSGMNPKDKEIFPIDLLSIDDNEYIKTCVLGARQYCMKEDLSTLPKARRHQAM